MSRRQIGHKARARSNQWAKRANATSGKGFRAESRSVTAVDSRPSPWENACAREGGVR